MGNAQDKIEMLEKVINQINKNKKYASESGDPVVGLINSMQAEVETISSGSLVLDGILGGGFGKGRIVEIYGKPSSGKTSIAISTVANVQRDGGTAVYIDAENAFDPNYAKALGVNLDELFFAQPDSAEQALDLVADLTESQMVDIIVVDSVAALVPKRELEGDAQDVTVGELARLMSKQLRKLIKPASKNGTTVIFINQTRDKIGGFSPFGTPTETPGGQALKFYSSQRLEVSKGSPIKGSDKEVIGTEVRMKNKKNKIAPPFREGMTVITYAEGINREAEMITVGPDYGVIDKPNARRYEDPKTGEVIGTSKDSAIEALKENPELFARLTEDLSLALNNAKLGDDPQTEYRKEESEEDEEANNFDPLTDTRDEEEDE